MPVLLSLSSRASRSDRAEGENHQRTRCGRCRHHPHARHRETSLCDHPMRRGREIGHSRPHRLPRSKWRDPTAAAAAEWAASSYRVRIDKEPEATLLHLKHAPGSLDPCRFFGHLVVFPRSEWRTAFSPRPVPFHQQLIMSAVTSPSGPSASSRLASPTSPRAG
jgi:hypothetical protein